MTFEPTKMPNDMELEDWMPVFEPLEENNSLEQSDGVSLSTYMKMRKNGELDDLKYPWEEGNNETAFAHDGGNGYLNTMWGPEKVVNEDIMIEGTLDYLGRFQGDTPTEVEKRIAQQHPAPYIDDIQTESTDGMVVLDFSLPKDYNQEDWEQTVDTLVDIMDDFDQYQDDLETVSDQYPQ